MRRPINQKEKALLDEMSRATNPSKEALDHLMFELEASPIARRAFAAELQRLRALRDVAKTNKYRLPPRVRDAVDRATRAKDFDHLVALAEGLGVAAPAPELEPGSSG